MEPFVAELSALVERYPTRAKWVFVPAHGVVQGLAVDAEELGGFLYCEHWRAIEHRTSANSGGVAEASRFPMRGRFSVDFT